MRIDILTLFPEMCESVLGESIIGRARANGCVEINCHNIRDYTLDKHNRVDDSPYGGGTGMIMQTQPIYDCFAALCEETGTRPHLIYLSPQGKTLTQEKVKELSKLDNIALLCGHYEGIDQRVIDEIVDEEISIGDYVLTGGELPALILADSISRMLPGVDVFSSNDHMAILYNKSFVTDKVKYNATNGKAEWQGTADLMTEQAKQEYIDYYSSIVDNRYAVSLKLMKEDFFRFVYDNIN